MAVNGKRMGRGAAVANALAWAGLIILLAFAFALVDRFGFAGMLLLGLATALVGVSAELHEETPSGHVAALRGQRAARESETVEEQASRRHAHQAFLTPLRFYRWCGMALIGFGLTGTMWQLFGAG